LTQLRHWLCAAALFHVGFGLYLTVPFPHYDAVTWWGADMQRRGFITLLGIAAAWPMAAQAQQSTKVHRIAVAHPSHPLSEMTENGGNPNYRVFFEELRSLGYVEGHSLAVARYSGGGLVERYAELAREVVRTQPDVIFALSSRMVLDFKAATNTIPIVGVTGDPIALGVAESLAHPGGNFTGAISDTGPEYYAKLLELLKEALPTLSSVGFIASPAFWGSPLGLAMRDAAPHLGIELIPNLLEHYEEADYRKAFGAMAQRRVDAVLTSDQSENFTRRRLIVELAETNRLPTMTPYLEIVEIGGLIAYATDRKEQFRYVASCVDKVLRGENPGTIPIYQSMRLSLAINLKTAKALGIAIPTLLLARADEVIE
jgi:putative ABC transport system substrate-binding protein